MEVENLVRVTLDEIEKVLSTRTVVGEPLTVEGTTIIPLTSVGFGFGVGGGSGKGEAKQTGEGAGGGSGGGAWVRPVAIIVIDKEGTRLEPLMGGLASAVDRIGERIPRTMERFVERWVRRKGEQKKEG